MSRPTKYKHDPRFRNISRYDYDHADFEGWRVCVTRQKLSFCKYVSDLEYGSKEASFKVALELRDLILQALREQPESPQVVIALFNERYPSPRRGRRPGSKRAAKKGGQA